MTVVALENVLKFGILSNLVDALTFVELAFWVEEELAQRCATELVDYP